MMTTTTRPSATVTAVHSRRVVVAMAAAPRPGKKDIKKRIEERIERLKADREQKESERIGELTRIAATLDEVARAEFQKLHPLPPVDGVVAAATAPRDRIDVLFHDSDEDH